MVSLSTAIASFPPALHASKIRFGLKGFPDGVNIVAMTPPFDLKPDESGSWFPKPGDGGLVTGLSPLSDPDDVWLSLRRQKLEPGQKEVEKKLNQNRAENVTKAYVDRLEFSDDVLKGFYHGVSNGRLWPLFHNYPKGCVAVENRTMQNYWQNYVEVNRAFAEEAFNNKNSWEFFNDYHFMLAPEMLRQQALRGHKDEKIAYYHHIPFPDMSILGLFPHAEELVKGLLGADLVGFQVPAYTTNFLKAVTEIFGHQAKVVNQQPALNQKGSPVKQNGVPLIESADVIYQGRRIHVGSYPFGLSRQAMQTKLKTIEKLREQLPTRDEFVDHLLRNFLSREHTPEALASLPNSPRQIGRLGVSVERMDYSKGILMHLKTIENLLDRDLQNKRQNPDYEFQYIGKSTFLQVAVIGNRSELQSYTDLQNEVKQKARQINEKFSRYSPRDGHGKLLWQPVALITQAVPNAMVLRLYQDADFALVTPHMDGMNVVAKEVAWVQDPALRLNPCLLIVSNNPGVTQQWEQNGALDSDSPFKIDYNPVQLYPQSLRKDGVSPSTIKQAEIAEDDRAAKDAADAIEAAFGLPPDEQWAYMNRLKQDVEAHPVEEWAAQLSNDFKQAAKNRNGLDALKFSANPFAASKRLVA
ncbi:MAG: trehalose-6-phosphate synthase [Vampirovibrionales bacterium]|nr:trehalose-6-phosphate synthase [Vampirovibrionales bacterium]